MVPCSRSHDRGTGVNIVTRTSTTMPPKKNKNKNKRRSQAKRVAVDQLLVSEPPTEAALEGSGDRRMSIDDAIVSIAQDLGAHTDETILARPTTSAETQEHEPEAADASVLEQQVGNHHPEGDELHLHHEPADAPIEASVAPQETEVDVEEKTEATTAGTETEDQPEQVALPAEQSALEQEAPQKALPLEQSAPVQKSETQALGRLWDQSAEAPWEEPEHKSLPWTEPRPIEPITHASETETSLPWESSAPSGEQALPWEEPIQSSKTQDEAHNQPQPESSALWEGQPHEALPWDQPSEETLPWDQNVQAEPQDEEFQNEPRQEVAEKSEKEEANVTVEHKASDLPWEQNATVESLPWEEPKEETPDHSRDQNLSEALPWEEKQATPVVPWEEPVSKEETPDASIDQPEALPWEEHQAEALPWEEHPADALPSEENPAEALPWEEKQTSEAPNPNQKQETLGLPLEQNDQASVDNAQDPVEGSEDKFASIFGDELEDLPEQLVAKNEPVESATPVPKSLDFLELDDDLLGPAEQQPVPVQPTHPVKKHSYTPTGTHKPYTAPVELPAFAPAKAPEARKNDAYDFPQTFIKPKAKPSRPKYAPTAPTPAVPVPPSHASPALHGVDNRLRTSSTSSLATTQKKAFFEELPITKPKPSSRPARAASAKPATPVPAPAAPAVPHAPLKSPVNPYANLGQTSKAPQRVGAVPPAPPAFQQPGHSQPAGYAPAPVPQVPSLPQGYQPPAPQPFPQGQQGFVPQPQGQQGYAPPPQPQGYAPPPQPQGFAPQPGPSQGYVPPAQPQGSQQGKQGYAPPPVPTFQTPLQAPAHSQPFPSVGGGRRVSFSNPQVNTNVPRTSDKGSATSPYVPNAGPYAPSSHRRTHSRASSLIGAKGKEVNPYAPANQVYGQTLHPGQSPVAQTLPAPLPHGVPQPLPQGLPLAQQGLPQVPVPQGQVSIQGQVPAPHGLPHGVQPLSRGQAPRVDPNALLTRQFPIFHWSTTDKIVQVVPPVANAYLRPSAAIQVRPASDVILVHSIKSFPGPLKGKAKRKEVEKWLETNILALEPSRTDEILINQVLLALVKHEDPSSQQYKHAVSAALNPVVDYSAVPPTDFGRTSTAPNAYRLDAAGINSIWSLLQTGHTENALQLAISRGDWALALIVANFMGPDRYARVAADYLRATFPAGNSHNKVHYLLPVLLKAFSGSAKSVVDDMRNIPAEGQWAQANYREILALVFVNGKPQDFLAEFGSYLASVGNTTASELCFVLAGLPLSTQPLANGATFSVVGSQTLTGAYTEVYELIQNAQYPHLLLLKLRHAQALADFGVYAEAQRYCDYIGGTLKQVGKTPFFGPQAFQEFQLLVVRISESSATDNSWFGSRISKVNLDKMWGQLDKFIGGDEPKPKNLDSTFSKFSPSVSRTTSTLDFTATPVHETFSASAPPSAKQYPFDQPRPALVSAGSTNTVSKYLPNPSAFAKPLGPALQRSEHLLYKAGNGLTHSLDTEALQPPKPPLSRYSPMNKAGSVKNFPYSNKIAQSSTSSLNSVNHYAPQPQHTQSPEAFAHQRTSSLHSDVSLDYPNEYTSKRLDPVEDISRGSSQTWDQKETVLPPRAQVVQPVQPVAPPKAQPALFTPPKAQPEALVSPPKAQPDALASLPKAQPDALVSPPKAVQAPPRASAPPRAQVSEVVPPPVATQVSAPLVLGSEQEALASPIHELHPRVEVDEIPAPPLPSTKPIPPKPVETVAPPQPVESAPPLGGEKESVPVGPPPINTPQTERPPVVPSKQPVVLPAIPLELSKGTEERENISSRTEAEESAPPKAPKEEPAPPTAEPREETPPEEEEVSAPPKAQTEEEEVSAPPRARTEKEDMSAPPKAKEEDVPAPAAEDSSVLPKESAFAPPKASAPPRLTARKSRGRLNPYAPGGAAPTRPSRGRYASTSSSKYAAAEKSALNTGSLDNVSYGEVFGYKPEPKEDEQEKKEYPKTIDDSFEEPEEAHELAAPQARSLLILNTESSPRGPLSNPYQERRPSNFGFNGFPIPGSPELTTRANSVIGGPGGLFSLRLSQSQQLALYQQYEVQDDTVREYVPVPEDDEEDEEERKRRKKQEEEARLARIKADKQRQQAEAAAARRNANGGWLSFFNKNNNGQEKKVYKAHLGGPSTFVYDEKLKRYIDKSRPLEEQLAEAKPPPPPKAGPASGPPSGPPGGPPVPSTGASAPPAPSGAPPGPSSGGPAPGAPGAPPGRVPPGKKGPSLATAGLDDLLSLGNGSSGSVASTRRGKKAKRGYVNVLEN